jgi:MFS family permease
MSKTRKSGGIFYGWWMVAASFFLFLFCGGTSNYGVSAFFNPIIAEMGWTRAQTSFAFSLRSVEGGLVQPFLGFFVDRMGTRKCIFVGILMMGLAYCLMSRTSSLYAFYGSCFLLAFGNTMSGGIPQQAAIANWFKKRRTLALGILTAGTGMAGIMAPVIVYLTQDFGWRQAMFFLCPMVLIIGLPLSLVIRHRPQPYGLLPDGEKITEHPTRENDVNAAGMSVMHPATGLTLKETLKTGSFWLLFLSSFLTGFAPHTIQVHLIPYITGLGLSENTAALTLTGYTVLSVVGRLGFAALGDSFDKKRLFVIAALIEAVGVFILTNISAPWMILPFLVSYGLGYGGTVPLTPAMQADCFGTKSFASIRGLMMLSHTIPGILGPFLAGWLYDVMGNYNLIFTALAVLCCLAAPVVMLVKLTPVKDRLETMKRAAG